MRQLAIVTLLLVAACEGTDDQPTDDTDDTDATDTDATPADVDASGWVIDANAPNRFEVTVAAGDQEQALELGNIRHAVGPLEGVNYRTISARGPVPWQGQVATAELGLIVPEDDFAPGTYDCKGAGTGYGLMLLIYQGTTVKFALTTAAVPEDHESTCEVEVTRAKLGRVTAAVAEATLVGPQGVSLGIRDLEVDVKLVKAPAE